MVFKNIEINCEWESLKNRIRAKRRAAKNLLKNETRELVKMKLEIQISNYRDLLQEIEELEV